MTPSDRSGIVLQIGNPVLARSGKPGAIYVNGETSRTSRETCEMAYRQDGWDLLERSFIAISDKVRPSKV